ncbi:MAG: DUF1704 domain-containing protein, partial [Magnetococcales bacterium]|nr:DUF1704 domain-containing protein [Magnetococcales bacterium]
MMSMADVSADHNSLNIFHSLFPKGLENSQLPIRKTLPDGGSLHLDRMLPFLCYYRSPQPTHEPGMAELLSGESAFIISHGETDDAILREVVHQLAKIFSNFMLLQIWSLSPVKEKNKHQEGVSNGETFQIIAQLSHSLEGPVKKLSAELRRCGPDGKKSTIKIIASTDHQSEPWGKVDAIFLKDSPPGLKRLGLGIQPFFQCFTLEDSCALFPAPHRNLRRCLSLALRKAMFSFTSYCSFNAIPHFQALGPRSVTEKTLTTDHSLAEITNQLDYLVYVTPVNTKAAWNDFCDNKFLKPPVFFYRPLPFDPVSLKRNLFKIPVDKIRDPALEALFREKSEELDSQINLLRYCGTDRFLPESLQLFGGVDASLHELAKTILEELLLIKTTDDPI